MFVRNGVALGSVLHSAVPGAPTPEPQISEPEPQPVLVADPEPAVVVSEHPDEPPRGGPNSTREAWAEFLDVQGVDYPDDPEEAGRNDLIAMWDASRGES